MYKLLMIANQFPPMGGAGVQRTSKFVKYLTKCGVSISVITKEVDGGLKDPTLSEDIPSSVRIYRLKAYDLENGTGFLRIPKKVLAKLCSPDSEIFWATKNRDRIFKIIEEEKPDILYTTSYPYSSHLLGLQIKKRYPDIPWIADYRDEWTNNPFHLDSRFRRMKLNAERSKELEVNRHCDFLIANTRQMLDNFVKDTPSLKDRSTFIPNGYDEDDFRGLERTDRSDSKFVITHTGSLYGRRNLDEILDALKSLIDRGEVDKNRIELRIVGNVHEFVLDDYRRKYDFADQIRSYGYMPHRQSIEMLFESDALLLLIGKGKGSGNFYTGKVFEYIRTGIPILGIVPRGAAAELLEETGTGLTADPEDGERVAAIVKKMYDDRFSGAKSVSPSQEAVQKYSRECQAKQLFDIMLNVMRKGTEKIYEET